MTVFVSHSSSDGDSVRALVQALNSAGSRVWLDQDLTGGEAWWSTILRQIRECSVFVFALSENSLQSEACVLELGYARDLGRPILPVQIGDVQGLRDHAIFTYQAIDYRNPTASSGIALVRAITERERDGQPLPDPLPAPPPMPYEYLMLLGTAIASREPISPSDQESIVKQLRQALRQERNDVILGNVRKLLAALRERPEVTYRTVNEVNELLSTPASGSPTMAASTAAPAFFAATSAGTPSTPPQASAPAGGPAPDWYPDARDRALQRYWDGHQWTQHTRPVVGGAQPLAEPAAGNPSKVLSVLAFVFTAMALVVPLIGLIGVGFGIAAFVRKEQQGRLALSLSVAVTVVSWIVWTFINNG